MTVPGRCRFDGDGKLRGPANVTYNTPFPTRNGSFGSGAMNGALMHTMVTDLPEAVTIFNTDRGANSASAHFGISQAGEIHQFGPVGKGWIAWHAMAANATYYGIEHADSGKPDTPLTDAQIAASAQVVEALSAFADFPLAVTDVPGGKGYGTHFMGGAAYGGHTCPDLPPQHVRSAQRAAILALAGQIRQEGKVVSLTTDGTKSLADIAADHGGSAAYILHLTAAAGPAWPPVVRDWLCGVFDGAASPTAPVPAGCVLRVPAT
ncbi:MAG TPA: peptidoglycan recognition family protein [Streptosporangiaceae bacterium]